MKQKLENIFIPFPKGMLSSVRTSVMMSTEYARRLRNMYVRADGSGSKRNGFSVVGAEISGEDIVQLFTFTKKNGDVQTLAVVASGHIYMRVGDTGSWSSVWSGLSAEGVVRGAFFNDELVLCNGVDPLLLWNGSVMQEITQWVTDLSTGLTRIDDDSVNIDSDADLYPVGREIQFTDTDGITYETTVASVVGSNPIQVNVVDAVVPIGLDSIAYKVKPPTFREVYAAHDRLWGIGDTPLSRLVGESEHRMRVYYTDGVNNPSAWYSAEGFLQSINLTDKTNTSDELVGMRVKDGLTIFFGRENLQVWQGYDPTSTGDFYWQQTLPVGAVHPALIVDMPNDIGFMTVTGFRTLSRTLTTENLAVGDIGREVDTLIADDVAALKRNEDLYKKAAYFNVPKQGWFGFHINGKSLIFQVNGSGQGWSIFDGLFAESSAFFSASELYVASGSQVLRYDDTVFSDYGNIYTVEWFTPWINPNNGFKRFACMGFELLTEQEAALEVTVERYREYDTTRPVTLRVSAQIGADFWDETDWENAYWDNKDPKRKIVRDKCVASSLAYKLTEESSQGPLTLLGMALYGVKER